MTKVDIFSGFLGAGKTTLIKKLIKEAYSGEKLVLIENEFGEIGVDGGFMQDAGIEVTEMNSGCICCSLVGDFGKALQKVLDEYEPDRIIIEPSGVGKLSDVISAVRGIASDKLVLNGFTTVADAGKCKMYMKNFGEFFNNQIENASSIILSHVSGISQEKIETCVKMIRELNPTASIVTTEWDKLSGKQILETMEKKDTLMAELERLESEAHCGHHDEDDHEHHDHEHCHDHHHDEDDEHDHHHEHEHDHDENCTCGCHDHEHDPHAHDEHECEEHHHEHCHGDEHHHDGEHEHHHEHEHEHEHNGHTHDENCTCGCHDHDGHHHHHHADEVFTSWGVETAKKFTKEFITSCLNALQNDEMYGTILRAKGIVEAEDGSFIYFDYVPGEPDVRTGSASTTGRICVIGSKINEEKLSELFLAK